MRVAVIMVWRPKNYPTWTGRDSELGRLVPPALADDKTVSPYTAIHIAIAAAAPLDDHDSPRDGP